MVTGTCGTSSSVLYVITSFRGSGSFPASIQICQSIGRLLERQVVARHACRLVDAEVNTTLHVFHQSRVAVGVKEILERHDGAGLVEDPVQRLVDRRRYRAARPDVLSRSSAANTFPSYQNDRFSASPDASPTRRSGRRIATWRRFVSCRLGLCSGTSSYTSSASRQRRQPGRAARSFVAPGHLPAAPPGLLLAQLPASISGGGSGGSGFGSPWSRMRRCPCTPSRTACQSSARLHRLLQSSRPVTSGVK